MIPFSLRALQRRAKATLNVVWNRQTIVLELVESDQPWLSVVFEQTVAVSGTGRARGVPPSRPVGLLDTARAYPLLKRQQPAAVAGVESVRPRRTHDYGDDAIRIIALVAADLWHDGELVVPAGTEVQGRARVEHMRERIVASGPWTLVWQTGEELTVNGIALDRDEFPSAGSWGLTDGSAGLRGQVLRNDAKTSGAREGLRLKQGHGILPHHRVAGGQPHASIQSPTPEHAIERVAVRRGKTGQSPDRGLFEGQRRNPVQFALSRHVNLRRLRQEQLAQGVLHDDLPDRNHAQEDLVVGSLNVPAGFLRQGSVSGNEPEEIACIEKDPHAPSKSRSTCSGKGELKSAGTRKSPRANP